MPARSGFVPEPTERDPNSPWAQEEPICKRCGEYMDFIESSGVWNCPSCGRQVEPATCVSCDSTRVTSHGGTCKNCQEAEDKHMREQDDEDWEDERRMSEASFDDEPDYEHDDYKEGLKLEDEL